MATGTIKSNSSIMFNGTADSIVDSGFCVGIYDPVAKLVTIYISAQASSNISTTQTIYTIPSQYAPSANYGIPALVFTSSDIPVMSNCRVKADATIIQSATSYGRKVFSVGVYPVN